jgi:glycosyltransferase involved in cell wall biosynthesis
MKICYLCADRGIPLHGTKGASAHVRAIVKAFACGGHDVVVLASGRVSGSLHGADVRSIPESEIIDEASSIKSRQVGRALRHIWHNACVEDLLMDVVDSDPPDLLYERYSPFSIAGGVVAKRRGLFHILEVNAPLAWEGKRYRNQALSEAANALESVAYNNASIIITVSDELRNTLVHDGVSIDKIRVVPNGVDGDLFHPQGPSARDGLDGKVVLGFVGSLKGWHGIELLADTFRRLAEDRRLHLLVVGDGPLCGEIAQLHKELPGRVTHASDVPHQDVPAYLRAMDIALAPYPDLDHFYYSPLKVLEYMAAGRAIVASDIGQIKDLIRHGQTGHLVPPGDSEALAEAIRGLANDENARQALGCRAAKEARDTHLWTHRAEEILQMVGTVPCLA